MDHARMALCSGLGTTGFLKFLTITIGESQWNGKNIRKVDPVVREKIEDLLNFFVFVFFYKEDFSAKPSVVAATRKVLWDSLVNTLNGRKRRSKAKAEQEEAYKISCLINPMIEEQSQPIVKRKSRSKASKTSKSDKEKDFEETMDLEPHLNGLSFHAPPENVDLDTDDDMDGGW